MCKLSILKWLLLFAQYEVLVVMLVVMDNMSVM